MSKIILLFNLFLSISPFLCHETENCETYREIVRGYTHFKGVRSTNCCKLTGCLANHKGSSYEHWPTAPWCLDKIRPDFYLYTPENVDGNQTIDVFDLNQSVKNIKINGSRELFAIIHGWNTQWVLTEWMFPMKDALIAKGNNVIIVGWSGGSNVKDYFQAATNTLPVGTALGIVISAMVDQGKADLNSTTIVGFSLGAHVAGFAGKNLTALKRIIALDPAGPMFVCEDTETRLDETDAKFVQVLHTNGQLVLFFGRGTVESMGTVDFYANGGLIQPGCEAGIQQTMEEISQFNFSNVWSNTACSHARAPLIFTEMIKRSKDSPNTTSCSFKSFPCDDYESWKNGRCFTCPDTGCPLPGPQLDFHTPYKGKYYFGTQSNSAPEFCGRQCLLTLWTDVEVKGQIFVLFRGSSIETNSTKFQSETSEIEKHNSKTRVFTLPWNMDKISQVLLTYTRYTHIIFESGVKHFVLTNATIETMDGSTVSSCSPVTVNHGEPAAVKFPPCSE